MVYVEPENAETYNSSIATQKTELKDFKKTDSKALIVIHQEVNGSIFPKIVAATRWKYAWKILQQEFQGTDKVIGVKPQTLHRDFENLYMKSSESIQEHTARITVIINHRRAYGEDIYDTEIVETILRSIPTKFDHVVN